MSIKCANTVILQLSLIISALTISVLSFAQDSLFDDGATIPIAKFGPQTGHPLSIERVLSAYDQLSEDSRYGVARSQLTPTHRYVRFMPSSEEQMWNIQKNDVLDLYSYPLDCEISEGFVGIVNPFLLNGFPQFWCIVSNDVFLDSKDCPFVIESLLWIPDNLFSENRSDCFPQKFISSIMSVLLPGYYIEEGVTRLSPFGIIRYMDTYLGQTPIEGITVQAFNFWQSYSALTNHNGYFYMSGASFNGDYRFRVKFSRSDFVIRHDDSNTDLEFVSSITPSIYQNFTGDYAKYSVVFQAAEHMYYKQTDIPQPPLSSFWNTRLRIRVFADSFDPNAVGRFHSPEWYEFFQGPRIDIYGLFDVGDPLTSDQLYGTAIHELGHAIHYGLNGSLYDSIQRRVKESFANGIELFYALQRYSDYDFDYYSVELYTGIMRDIMDECKFVHCYNYYDRVTNTTTTLTQSYYDDIYYGLTIAQLVESVRTCTSPQQWFNRIYQLYHLPGEELSNAFDFWFDFSN